ncbi:MAG: glycosyltransferase [Oligosphaeraceae bacterium]
MAPRLHILGHPDFPLGDSAHPEDSQLFNCWNFCQLAEAMGISYAYYGAEGSRCPPGGQGTVVSLGDSPERWAFRSAWHREYTRRLNTALRENLRDDGEPEWVASIYGVAQCDVTVSSGVPVFEPMLGYGTCWTHYRVFPSYAHQQVIYTRQPETQKDRYFDTVIPHFLNPGEYPFQPNPGEYLVYLGRAAEDKGVALARETAALAGLEFREVHRGCAGLEKARLLGEARAVLMPTLYLEPFGYVAIEALMCGTPVITTDWGSFPEIVREGVDGFRCRTQTEFSEAVRLAPGLDRALIRRGAEERFTVAAVAERYRRYLDFIWKTHRYGGYYAPGATRKEPTC